MPARIDTYAPTRPVPYLLVRGALQTLECPMRHGATGALVAPASGTITITRPDGTTLVSEAAVTVSSSTATYDITPAASETLGLGWTVTWALTFGSAAYPAIRCEAVLCEYVPPCAISALDLFAREPELRMRVPQAQGDRGDGSGWQTQIDVVYYELIQRLIDDGRPIHLVRGVTGTREWMVARTLELCCATLSTASGSEWSERTTRYMWEARRAQTAMRVNYSSDPASVRRGAQAVIRLCPP